MVEPKTKQTAASVDAFLDAVEPPRRREDAKAVCAMMAAASGEPPRLWGSSIVGFGRYAYRYDSGHSGESARIGFSPRKNALVLYLVDGFPRHADLMARLGKYTTGKSCLYIKKLADIDEAVLAELVAASFDHMRSLFPEHS